MRFLNVCQPIFFVIFGKTLRISSYFPFDNQHDLGGENCQVHGYANDMPMTTILETLKTVGWCLKVIKKVQKSPKQPPFWM